MVIFMIPSKFCSRIPAETCKPCNARTPVRQRKARRRLGENMECDREGADPKAARVYSAKTREFAAPRARLIMKKM